MTIRKTAYSANKTLKLTLVTLLLSMTWQFTDGISPVEAQVRAAGYASQPYQIQPIHSPVAAPLGGGYAPGAIARPSFGYVSPSYSMPLPLTGGNYMINGNPFWYSSSGYYYPWTNNSAYGQIIYAPQTNQTPVAQVPPLSTVFADLLKYLDEKKANGKISASDYQHLRRRATDLQTKYFSLRNAAAGSIDERDEAQIRRDLDELGAEVAKSVIVS